MLGVVGFELLPESLRQNQTLVMSTPTPLVLFVGGHLLLHVIERSFALHRGHAVAVIAHDFADGFNTYTITTLYGNDRRRGLLLLGADAAAPLLGAGLSLSITISTPALGAYLGFFAGVLMYLATADVLPEAHAQNSSALTLAATVAGAGLLLAIVSAAG